MFKQGQRQAFIGIGGGSDCIQAAIVAMLSGNESCVISIRRDKLGSQTAHEALGTKRTVHNHGGEISQGVFRVTPETTGSGRFLEFIPAEKMPTYLVIDSGDGRLQMQVEDALNDFGGVDSVVALDTGGDALFRVEQAQDVVGVTSPDQDICSLLAIAGIQNIELYSAIVANGIDAPDYSAQILQQADARYFQLNDSQSRQVLETYKNFQLDGSHPERYGLTCFSWQAALRKEFGKVAMPLPDHLINHPTNPWNPVVDIREEMAGIYIMDLDKHVAAITSPASITSDPEVNSLGL